MAKVAVPIIKLRYDSADAYPNDVVAVFEDAGAWTPAEDYTFTGRVSIDADTPKERTAQRNAIAAKLCTIMPRAQAERLITLLDEHNWDVSFFVDCW